MLSRRILALAALLAAGAPPAAARAAAAATSVVSANVAGPSATFTEVAAGADCGTRRLSGGGTRLAQTTQTVEHNGIHIDGSFPSPDGSAQAGDGDLGPSHWVAAGGSGGGVPNDAQTLAYALCLDAGPASIKVVVASTSGPAATFQTVRATASCPAGTRLLSGGSRATPGKVGSLKPNGSFPSDASGTPILAGANPTSWTVSGLNGGGGDEGNRTYAFALCAVDASDLTVTVVHGQVPGPALASTPAQTTVSCPPSMVLLGGGGFISDALGLPGSQGDHLTGSYPSDETGTPVASGAAASWTVASHTGGVDSGGLTQTDAWAMCASPAGAPPPTPGGPGIPAGTAPPAISGTPKVGQSLAARHGSWTNQPTGFVYRWLRCRSSGSTCVAVAGAGGGGGGPGYRLTTADLGSRIRVQETASNSAGRSVPAVSSATAAVQGGRVTVAQIRALLAREIVPPTGARKVKATRLRGGAVLEFTAPEAGRAVVAWSTAGAGGHLLAEGRRTFPEARASTIDVRVTAAGRGDLKIARRLRLIAQGTFTPRGKEPTSVTKTFVLTP